jgi:hypothetical protein
MAGMVKRAEKVRFVASAELVRHHDVQVQPQVIWCNRRLVELAVLHLTGNFSMTFVVGFAVCFTALSSLHNS